jgi:hypothetical protein
VGRRTRSFPDRETAARELGEGPWLQADAKRRSDFKILVDTLNKAVRSARDRHVPVTAISVGHSLGGKVLFESIEAQLKNQNASSSPGLTLDYFGDVIVLVNPASDANDYGKFVDYNLAHHPHRPVMVAVSSEGDEVVSNIYHRGESLKDFFKPHAADPKETFGLGWLNDHVTHLLCPEQWGTAQGACTDKNAVISERQSFGTTRKTELRTLGGPTTDGPFIVIRSSADVIPKHSDIFGDAFREFLVGYISKVVRPAAEK